MKDRERLEELINRKPSRWGNLTIKEFERDIKILQKQAEEKQELEERFEILSEQHDLALQQNKRYREALELYADERNYKERDFGIIVQPAIQEGDRGNTARNALEGEE